MRVAPDGGGPPPPCGGRRGCRPPVRPRPRRAARSSARPRPPRPGRAARGGGRASRCGRGARPTAPRSVKTVPARPSDSISVARTSASGPSPKVRTVGGGHRAPSPPRAGHRHSARPARRRAARRAAPTWRARCASMLPARSRWVGCTARTTPTSGRAISARRAISPSVYMLISSTATSCARLQAEQRHRQAGLGVEVALVAQDA